jgi:mono/diheme cytochrome c family protein
MKYFFAIWFLLVVVVLGVCGLRYDHGGSMTRRPPVEIFPDMHRQAKLRPMESNYFFANGLSSRLPVTGTIARGSAYEDTPVNTGFVPGTTNFVETIPVPVTEKLLARGRERFSISCLPCHGAQADGNGVTKKLGMAVVANLHDARIVKLADGEIFNVISNGRNLMQGYGANVTVADRWAIIAYVRTLQLSHLGMTNDLPAEILSSLKK